MICARLFFMQKNEVAQALKLFVIHPMCAVQEHAGRLFDVQVDLYYLTVKFS
ncbi:hypothetical protein GPUN_0392 [Glaciecola punicea ACAM 611]|uniref:Uncharacterized protein n=1 Tax=Glaciecola punicea ACAM 611 TaxID=1121923 RepID=H5T898_9ALTE|nr:hypothetical protein GPUN_0392 [Glaciecola punicea ACAM 611]